jgi:hypothetical protein
LKYANVFPIIEMANLFIISGGKEKFHWQRRNRKNIMI